MLLPLLLLSSLIQFYEVRCGVLFPFGPEAGDSQGSGTADIIYLRAHKRFRVFGKRFKNLYICSNGFVALGRPYCKENPISYADGHALLAPFWIAQDTNSTAKIWYRTTRDPSILNDAANQLTGYFDTCKPADFRPRELIIVTWSNVGQVDACLELGISADRCRCLYNPPEYLDPRRMTRYCDCIERPEPAEYCRCEALVQDTGLCRRTPKGQMDHSNAKRDVGGGTNTYQIAIVSGKNNTFVILSYNNIEWISSNQIATDGATHQQYPVTYKAFVGFVSRGRAFYTLPESKSDSLYDLAGETNIGYGGVHAYKVNGQQVQGTQCQYLSAAEQASAAAGILYPFGPEYGDRSGPAVGEAHLVFDNGIPYYGRSYHDVWASSFGRVAFAADRPNALSGAITPGLNVFFAHQDLRSPYQSDDIYLEYDTGGDPEAMLSSHFWYRVSTDPLLLARAQSDLQQVADPDFVPSSVAVITWYRSQSVDECARHGFRPDFCECMFVTNTDTRCACLVNKLINYYDDFDDYYYAAEGSCDYAEEVTESDMFLESGPYTEENTYQAVLVTDSVDTYILVNYPNITWYANHFFAMKYLNGPRYPTVEYAKLSMDNGTTDTTVTHPFSETSDVLSLPAQSNVGVPGRYAYEIGVGEQSVSVQ